jgi:periplasmic protein CpxP/Spy
MFHFFKTAGPRRRFYRHLLLPGTFATTALIAGCGWHGGPGHHWQGTNATPEQRQAHMAARLDWALDWLKANDTQKTQIRAIFDNARPEMQKLMAERKALRDEIAKALSADVVDAQEVARLKSNALTLVERAANLWTDATLKAANVLTPEQRKQLVDFWNRWS